MGDTHSRRSAMVLTVLVLFVTACGGDGGQENAAGSAGAGTEGALATVVRIDAAVDARIDTATDFTEVGEAVEVNAGDEVRTDTTGFAEITYFDNSLTRLDVDTTFTVAELTGNDTYQVDTSVATATVRGTAFLITCPDDTTCTFDILEGTVEITPTTGDPVTLDAGESLTVTADQPPGDPEAVAPTVLGDDWITRNIGLDADAGYQEFETAIGADPGGDDDRDADTATLLEGDYVLTVSDARLLEATGDFEGASVTVEDTTIVVRQGSTGSTTPLQRTVPIRCDSDGCDWIVETPFPNPVYVELDGGPPFRLLSQMTGEPLEGVTVCGYVRPPEAFVIDDITENSQLPLDL